MSQGLQVYNASGTLILDTSDNAGRVLGVVTISGTSSGSTTDAALSTGRPFFALLPINTNYNLSPPAVSISGTTISWGAPGSSTPTYKIIYGVY